MESWSATFSRASMPALEPAALSDFMVNAILARVHSRHLGVESTWCRAAATTDAAAKPYSATSPSSMAQFGSRCAYAC